MNYLETDYLKKAAIARRLKARIFGPLVSKQRGPVTLAAAAKRQPNSHNSTPHTATGAFSIIHHMHMHLLPVAAPLARAPVNSRADDGVDRPREDAA